MSKFEKLAQHKKPIAGAAAGAVMLGMTIWGVETYQKAASRPDTWALPAPTSEQLPANERMRNLAARVIARYDDNPADRNAVSSPYMTSVRVPLAGGDTLVMGAQGGHLLDGTLLDAQYVTWVGMREEHADGSAPTTLDIYTKGFGGADAYWGKGSAHVAEVNDVLIGDAQTVAGSRRPNETDAGAIEDQVFLQAEALANTPSGAPAPDLIPLAK